MPDLKAPRPPMPRWAKAAFGAIGLLIAVALVGKLSGHGNHMGMH